MRCFPDFVQGSALAFATLATGWLALASPAPAADPIKDPVTRQRFARAGADMRTLNVALQCYLIDHNTPPLRPEGLTTPISYITSIPNDPFANGPYRIVQADPNWTLKEIRIVSVGPDGVFDEGMPLSVDDPELIGDIVSLVNPGNTASSGFEHDAATVAALSQPLPKPPLEATVERAARGLAGAARGALPHAPEPETRAKVSRVRSDLRSMATALESYRVDHDTLPDRLEQLSTPVAYLTSMFIDPFAPTDAPRPERWFRSTFSEDYSSFITYSVGPDGRDDKARIEYDPTNGTESAGDLTRTHKIGFYFRTADPKLDALANSQHSELTRIGQAIDAYYLTNRSMPAALSNLTTPIAYLESMPEDLFARPKPLRYVYDRSVEQVWLYSVGPDKLDQGGQVHARGRYGANETPKGDIVLAIDVKAKEAALTAPPTQDDGTGRVLAQLENKAKLDGQPNALIHYLRAVRFVSQNTLVQPAMEQVEAVQKDGWSPTADARVMPILMALAPAFDEVRAGAKVGRAVSAGVFEGAETPVPNFLATQWLAKLMMADGRRLESEGNHRAALENYMAVYRMGTDYACRDQVLISSLIGIAIRSIATRQLARMGALPDLPREMRQELVRQMEAAESWHFDGADMLAGEQKYARSMATSMADRLSKMTDEEVRKELMSNPSDPMARMFGASREQAMKTIETLIREQDQVQEMMLRNARRPMWERDLDVEARELEELLGTLSHWTKMVVPNFTESVVRLEVCRALGRVTLVQSAAWWSAADNQGKASSSPVPGYLAGMPQDPFSGKPVRYAPQPDGSFQVWSVGPDRIDQQGAFRYDPTNGTTSQGDILPPM